MAHSARALEFIQIPASEHVRFEDRVSYLYLEHARVHGDRTGVWAVCAPDEERPHARGWTGRLQIPTAGIAVLMLGPGTSITQPAILTVAASGTTVLFTGGEGFPLHAACHPTTTTGRWATAQATLHGNHANLVTAARTLYKARFPSPAGDVFDRGPMTIERLRGMEGRLVRDTYQQQARTHGLARFRREVTATDPVNVSLNIGNSILYGLAASVCGMLSLNPSLGIIHRGDVRAFLHDLADVYKLDVTVPVAFAATSRTSDVPAFTRTAVRSAIHNQRVMQRMMNLTTDLLSPHLPRAEGDVLLGDTPEVTGEAHRNHSSTQDEPCWPS